jgi:hypothetical protein
MKGESETRKSMNPVGTENCLFTCKSFSAKTVRQSNCHIHNQPYTSYGQPLSSLGPDLVFLPRPWFVILYQ